MTAQAPQTGAPTRGDHEELANMVSDRLDQFTAQYKSDLDAFQNDLRKDIAPDPKQVEAVAKVGADVKALNEELARLKRVINDAQLKGRAGDRSPEADARTMGALEFKSAGAQYRASEDYKAWAEHKSRHTKAPGIAEGVKFWPGQEIMHALKNAQLYNALRGLTRKSVATDSTNAGDVTIPQYVLGIIDLPKFMPVLRRLGVSILSLSTDSFIMDRETARPLFKTTLASAVTASDTTIALTEAQGLHSDASFNTITLSDGTNTETLTGTISGTTFTLVSPATVANDYATADTTITAQNITTTATGLLAPYAGHEIIDDTVKLADITFAKKVSMNIVNDSAQFDRWMRDSGTRDLARMADLNHFFGPTGSPMVGLMNDPDLVSFGNWSTFAVGTSPLDYLLEGAYEVMYEDYVADGAVISPQIHRRLTLNQGDDGHYIFFMNNQVGVPGQIMAMQVEHTTAMQPANGLVGEYSSIIIGENTAQQSVEIGLEDDDLRRRRRTALFLAREGLGNPRPRGFRKLNYNSAPVA